MGYGNYPPPCCKSVSVLEWESTPPPRAWFLLICSSGILTFATNCSGLIYVLYQENTMFQLLQSDFIIALASRCMSWVVICWMGHRFLNIWHCSFSHSGATLQNKQMFNIICEQPETVAQALVPGLRSVKGTGTAVNYLTPPRIVLAILKAWFRRGRWFDQEVRAQAPLYFTL